MWQRAFVLALAIGGAPLLSIAPAAAQGYMPWPPPPGMTAGEYVRALRASPGLGCRSASARLARAGLSERAYRRDLDETGSLRGRGHRGWDGYYGGRGHPGWDGYSRPGGRRRPPA